MLLLPRAGRAQESDHLARLHLEVDIVQRLGAGVVAERDPVETDATSNCRDRPGIRSLQDRRLRVEHLDRRFPAA